MQKTEIDDDTQDSVTDEKRNTTLYIYIYILPMWSKEYETMSSDMECFPRVQNNHRYTTLALAYHMVDLF